MNTRKLGTISENKAIEFLKINNFEIITTNYYSKYGEIDIIAKKNNIVHFIEVKSSFKNFESIYNVTFKKLQKIVKTINIYISQNKIKNPYQIDVITIDNGIIKFIENISMF